MFLLLYSIILSIHFVDTSINSQWLVYLNFSLLADRVFYIQVWPKWKIQVVYKTLEEAMCTRMEWYFYSHIGDSFWDPSNCGVLRYVFSALYKFYEECYDRCRVGDGVLWSALKVASISCRIEWVNQCHKSPKGATINVEVKYLSSRCVSAMFATKKKKIADSLSLIG